MIANVANQPVLRRTALYDCHVAAGARMVEFGGWLMPVQYSGIIDEHHAVRRDAGIFDVSHMGRVVVAGPNAVPFLQRMLTNDAARLAVGDAQYSLLCGSDGGVLDDLFVWRTAADEYELVVNASNTSADVAWLADHLPRTGIALRNTTADTAMLAIQGPSAVARLQQIVEAPLDGIGRMKVARLTLAGFPATLYRGGYTGEDGFEVVLPVAGSVAIWHKLVDRLHVKPCGLGARDTLRLEAGLPLYGHELDTTITPLDARLGFAVRLDRGDFVGRSALLAQRERGPERLRIGFRLTERGIARSGQAILAGGRPAGIVSSGTFSPTLETSIGMGYLPSDLATVGRPIQVDVRGRLVQGETVGLPFVRRKRAE
ncbi:MAG: glycine cleavage system aminomethyltransferase GcvT [Chloroflexi bacterium]|nr:glycine cleavage system aminomethyltransferase GcvT [Chloroflexota bacterium]